MRSWRHKILHLPSGLTAPPAPVCDYEDEPEVAAPKKSRSAPLPNGGSNGSSSGKKKSKEGQLGAGREGELESRVQQLEDMLRLAVGAGISDLGSGTGPQQLPLRPDDILLAAPLPPAVASLPSPSFQRHPSDGFLQPPVAASPVQIWSYESPETGAQSSSVASGSRHSQPAGPMPTVSGFTSPPSAEGSKLTPDSMESPDDYLTELLWPGYVRFCAGARGRGQH